MVAKTNDFHKQNELQEAIGLLLKAHREHKNLNQRDIAIALRFKSVNYVSIIEKGNSNIPLTKIKDVAAAYQFDPIIANIITKYLNPDNWDLFMAMVDSSPNIWKTTSADIDREVKEKAVFYMKDYSLGKYTHLFK